MELFYHIIRLYSQEDDSLNVDFFFSEIMLTKFSTLTRTSSTFSTMFDTAVSREYFSQEGYLR